MVRKVQSPEPHPLLVQHVPKRRGVSLGIGFESALDRKYVADAGYRIETVNRQMISPSRDVMGTGPHMRYRSFPFSALTRDVRKHICTGKIRYDLVITLYSLPFMRKHFEVFAQCLADALAPGGRLICAIMAGTHSYQRPVFCTGWNAREFPSFFSPVTCARFDIFYVDHSNGHRGARYPHCHTVFWFVGDKPT